MHPGGPTILSADADVTDVTGSRALGNWYENTHSKWCIVAITVQAAAGGNKLNVGLLKSPDGGSTICQVSTLEDLSSASNVLSMAQWALVPPGWSYKFRPGEGNAATIVEVLEIC